MDYNSLIHSVPAEWKKCIKGKAVESRTCQKRHSINLNGRWKNVFNAQCRDYYWEFVSKFPYVPKAQYKWHEYMAIDQAAWPDYYQLPYLITRDTTLQSFQYKILHRFFPCNYTLSIWYKDQSAFCNVCKNETDHLEHYFFSCPHLSIFWTSIERWWLKSLDISVRLDTQIVMFGLVNAFDDRIIDIFNLSILIAKWHIYRCKKDNDEPSFYEYLRLLRETLETERLHCILKGDVTFFEKRWLLIYECL